MTLAEPKTDCQALMVPASDAKMNWAGAAGLVGVRETTKSLVALLTIAVGNGLDDGDGGLTITA